MNIPQDIKNKFMVREDYLEWIKDETSIFAYLDLTNIFHWQDVLGWKFRIEDMIGQLFTFPNIKEVKVYYGKNERDLKNSEAFHNRIKKTGAILRTKPPTPFYLYDEKGIRENAQKFIKAFSWAPGFKNYFAVKALPNPSILKILKKEGMGTDCSSLPELILSEKVGIVGESIMFTSNDTAVEDFIKAKELGVIINLDDISHIDYLEKALSGQSLPELICFRYNPGALRKNDGNLIIGKPEEAKYGLTREQLFEAYQIMKDKGVKRFGLHTMVVSNELELDVLAETADMLFSLAVEIYQRLDIKLEFVNLGGGIGIPYKPEQEAVNFFELSEKVKFFYEKKIVGNNLSPLKIFMECGRIITGPYGYLVTKVIHEKHTHKEFIGGRFLYG